MRAFKHASRISRKYVAIRPNENIIKAKVGLETPEYLACFENDSENTEKNSTVL